MADASSGHGRRSESWIRLGCQLIMLMPAIERDLGPRILTDGQRIPTALDENCDRSELVNLYAKLRLIRGQVITDSSIGKTASRVRGSADDACELYMWLLTTREFCSPGAQSRSRGTVRIRMRPRPKSGSRSA